MCHVLQYLCDCQVRHRIEAVVAFSDDFVACLQDNQRFRYNEVMLALNMSAALTAKKTKEFRSPPQEQVGTPPAREQRLSYGTVRYRRMGYKTQASWKIMKCCL